MTKPSRKKTGVPQAQRVVFQPAAALSFQKGINQMVNLVRPTYGPLPGTVANDRAFLGKDPEILDSGGTIVRRVPQITDRHANLGAMLVREALKQLQDRSGDGTALAAILMQSVFNEGLKMVTAGMDAMRLRTHLEDGLRLILSEMDHLTRSIEGEEALSRLALVICGDQSLSALLGEIFDVIGEYGRLEIRPGQGREDEREYVEGMYWEDGLIAREMATDPLHMQVTLENPAVLISNLEIKDAGELALFLDRVVAAGFNSLLMLTHGVTGPALALLVNPQNQQRIRVAAVKNYDTVGNQPLFQLQDLAILTGGQPVVWQAGDRLSNVTVEMLGRCRRAWADAHTFGVVGGSGSPRALRDHITRLRELHQATQNAEERQKIRQRIGKLLGGSAALYIGNENGAQVEARQALAEHTAEALRAALVGGVVPGGGAALIACQPALRSHLARPGLESEERGAYTLLLKALEAPLRQIAASAGLPPAAVVDQVARAPQGYGFDARTRTITDLYEAGILDPTPVIKDALHTGIATAALALTTEVLVHKAHPQDDTKMEHGVTV